MPERNILVVEDDDVQRRQLARALEKDAYTVFQASAGHETIRILEAQRIDLVLTDRKMPGMDGDWLLDYVRANYPGLPVVFITAYPDETAELEPDALLVKPYRIDHLRKIIRHCIEGQSP